MDISLLIGHLAPTVGVIATGWFGMRATKSANLNKSQFNELKNGLNSIHSTVNKVKKLGNENQEKIKEVSDRLKLHDDAHLVTMYMRLERDIKTDLERGYTTVHKSDIIHKMHTNYKELGGNGYIDTLFKKYQTLEIKE